MQPCVCVSICWLLIKLIGGDDGGEGEYEGGCEEGDEGEDGDIEQVLAKFK